MTVRDREREAGHPLMDNPMGEDNYLPAELVGKLKLVVRALLGGVMVLEMPDYKIEGKAGVMTGEKIYIPVRQEWSRLSTWLKNKGVEIGNPIVCQESDRLERFAQAREAGLPMFLAAHYAFSYQESLKFGPRYVGAKHVVVIGQPESGKSSLVAKMTEIAGVEKWNLETKYPEYDPGGGDLSEVSDRVRLQREEQKKELVDLRITTKELLDNLLTEMDEKSRSDGTVKMCVWDGAGFPRLEEAGQTSFMRPTDPLDLIETVGVWNMIFLLTRPLTSQTEQDRLEYFEELLR